MPRLCEFYPGICLITEEKARKNLCQGKKNLSHSTVYVLPNTPTHYKTLTNTHVTKPTHTHTHTRTYTHTTKQYKTTTVQITLHSQVTLKHHNSPLKLHKLTAYNLRLKNQ